jgi:hypothetical protein
MKKDEHQSTGWVIYGLTTPAKGIDRARTTGSTTGYSLPRMKFTRQSGSPGQISAFGGGEGGVSRLHPPQKNLNQLLPSAVEPK